MEFKRALVTGAADRLGRAMALALAARGVDVAIHYLSNEDRALETLEEVKALGVKAVALSADLLSLEETGKLVDEARDGLGGPLDILINNASIFEWDNVETATTESWSRHHLSNLQAPFVLTQAFADQAPKSSGKVGDKVSGAAIINLIDQRVRKLTPEFVTYSLAKHGAWAMTRITAQALAPHIRVNAIGPGPTLRGARQTEEHFAAQRANTILERGADPEDITQAMEFLLDAKSVTGQLICVDGGQHLAWQTPDVLGVE